MKRVLVMLVAAAMAASCTGKKQAESTASDEKVLTKTVPAALRVIEQNEVYTSEIEPYKENDITPAVSGVHIDRILVDVGSRVKAGQLLVTLDPTQYNQQRLQYQTALDDYNRWFRSMRPAASRRSSSNRPRLRSTCRRRCLIT